MKPKMRFALAVLIPTLLTVALVVASCGGQETTTTEVATTAAAVATTAASTTTEAVTTTSEAATTAQAATTPVSLAEPPGSLLIVGNSNIYVNDGVDNHLRELAASADPPRILQADRATVGGAQLRTLYQEERIQEAIRAGDYDVVMLQEDLPLYGEGTGDSFFEYGRLFDQEIRDAGGTTVLFMSWPYLESPDFPRGRWATLDVIAQAHRDLGGQLGVPVAPVALAFARSEEERPELAMLGEDKVHESNAGTYLAACVLYATLFGESPEGATYLMEGVSAPDAAFLQKVAWQTVQEWQRQ